jgi:uncharacterized DUF497 family protein
MQITFDLQTDHINTEKHGVSLALAEQLEWDSLIAVEDNRQGYGETRMIGFAPIVDRVYCVVYVDRNYQRRIISLRKANQREVTRYAIYINASIPPAR